MITDLATKWSNVPKFLRDFLEALLAAAVGGAATGVLSLDLDTANTKQVLAAVSFGALSAVIALARHRLAKPQ